MSKSKILLAATTAVVLSTSLPDAAEASPGRSCVKGAVTGSAIVWLGAIIISPLTGGGSLIVAPKLDAVIWSSTLGCVAGMTGEAAADTIFPEKDE